MQAAPEVDAAGNAINPHIPQYIAKAPWYVGSEKGLGHQRGGDVEIESKNMKITEVKPKAAVFVGGEVKKFRKGACENCGAMTHQKKDCVERPRAIGAKFLAKNLARDEAMAPEVHGYDAKRDRWAAYDPAEYKATMAKYELAEKERLRFKEEQLAREGKAAGKDGDGDDSEADDDMKEKDDVAMMQKKDGKNRATVRNLRIREDTAKYLRNLDVNSAHYDPKTRSMREDPNPNSEDATFRGDNWVRAGGQAAEVKRLELYQIQAAERGTMVNATALPSQAEKAFKDFERKKAELKETQRKEILEKYGGEEHLNNIPAALRFAQTEQYNEYTPDGRVLHGQAAVIPSSRYDEDVLVNNHTKVWGSWWADGKWGYGCCRQMMKSSYCTGAAGLEAAEQIARELEENVKRNAEKEALLAASGGRGEDPGAPEAKRRRIEEEEKREKEMDEYRKGKVNWDDPLAQMQAMNK